MLLRITTSNGEVFIEERQDAFDLAGNCIYGDDVCIEEITAEDAEREIEAGFAQ